MIWEIGDKLGLKHTEFEMPQVRNVQRSIGNVKLEQFKKEAGTGDIDFSGRIKCFLFGVMLYLVKPL